VALGTAVAGVPLVAWATRETEVPSGAFAVGKTDAEWRAVLDDNAYRILRRAHTERPYSSPLNDDHSRGIYACAGCGRRLFSSDAKFDSGTGWPSFTAPLDGAVGTRVDRALLMVRTEVHCAQCGGHLGHVFSDGPRPTGLRYCINGGALRKEPA
jgi:peptide-methionine (R)-S-oxide reductase